MKQGFVYIWYDNLRKMFYIGSHWGRSDDSYLCSNKRLYNAIKKRPENFKRRIIEKDIPDKKNLLEREQYWLNMIKDEELSSVSSVTNNTAKYYNYKKFASGGNGDANKGNSNIGGWNIGVTSEMLNLRKNNLFCLLCDKTKPNQRTVFFNKICPSCNNTFETNNKQKIYCSNKCWPIRNKKEKSVKTLNPLNTKKEKIIILHNNKNDNKIKNLNNCKNCNKLTENKIFCSKQCSGKYHASSGNLKPNFKKGREAWNKGKANPQASSNGIKGAKKQSQTVTGRRKTVREDGSWFWTYPE